MSPESWQRIKDLFHAALQLDPDSRNALLDAECRDEPALRAEVESLIASHEAEPAFIEHAALSGATSAGSELTDPLVGTTVGSYRLVRRIGFGGMGAVYLAVRVDDAYRKQVAVKILRADRFLTAPHRRAEMLRRFSVERQLLADLDHPNIARLIDGGAGDDGMPYLVMDYIAGRPIDEYCDAARLTTTQRLVLFRSVCEAVHYAHRHLVVHRDLKPSNILVTDEGLPRLLDFGISMLLAPPSGNSGGADGDRTQTGLQPMTPEYASPEQVRGQRSTTASDVYALGIVLYELLTGHRPYQLPDAAPHDLARVICEQQPDKPSTAVMRVERRATRDGSSWITLTPQSVSMTREGHPDRLRRRLSGDLDMIMLKALRKEPERRYGSIEQLSEDIRRHLCRLPVMARPDTAAYRASKFVRRHALAVAAAAVVVLVLAGATVATARSAREARRQRDLAVLQKHAAQENLLRAQAAEHEVAIEAASARRVTDFLVSVFEVSDPFFSPMSADRPGTQITAGEILAQAVKRIDAEPDDQPEVQARLMDTLGNVNANLGVYGEAERLLEASLRMRRARSGGESPDVATSLQSLGRLYLKLAEYGRAKPLLEEALAIRRSLLGDMDGRSAASLDDLARLATHQGNYDEAEGYYQQALHVYRTVLGPDHVYVAMSLANRATILHSQGRYAAAEPVYREALERLSAARGPRHPDVASVMENLGILLDIRGESQEAETLLRRVLDLRRALFGDEHAAVAQSLHNLAHVLSGQGDVASARNLYEQALDMRRKLLGSEHPMVADTLNDLAHLHYVAGEFDQAEPLFRAALAIKRKQYPEGHPSLALQLQNLASVFAAQGRYDESETMYTEALAMHRQRLGEDNPDAADTLHNLGGLLYLRGDLPRAEPLLRQALEIRRSTFGEDHEKVADSCNSLGALLRDLGDYEAAGELLRRGLDIRMGSLPAGHPSCASSMLELGVLMTAMGRADEAEPLLLEALEIRRRHYGQHWLTANAASALGACLAALGRFTEAEPLLTDAYSTLNSARGEDDPTTQRALRRVIDMYEASGNDEAADQFRPLVSESDVARDTQAD